MENYDKPIINYRTIVFFIFQFINKGITKRKERLMKKYLVLAMVLGVLAGNTAFADTESKGIAVVDIQKVVMNSAKVKQLEADRIKQDEDLQKFLLNAKKSVDTEKDETKKKTLQEKYNNELNQKLETAKKDVIKRTQSIEAEILSSIEKEAKAMGYDMVISKSTVLYGGADITDDIIKKVK